MSTEGKSTKYIMNKHTKPVKAWPNGV